MPGVERALALDLGGSRCRVALVRRDGSLDRKETFPTPRSPSGGLRRLTEAVRSLLAAAGRDGVRGLGVGVAGPVERRTGTLRHPPNLPEWDGVSLKQAWGKEFGLPVYVGNDANLAAWGEYRYGAGRGADHIVYLTLSTGIGGGVVIGGRLLEGALGYAGELGHITIDRRGPRCTCGNVGCFEALASGTAIARRARRRLAGGAPSRLRELAKGEPERIDAALVARAAREGDPVAHAVLEEAARAVGAGIVGLVHVFNPQRVIIGGGVGRAWPLLKPVVEDYVRRYAMPPFREGLSLVPSALGDDAGLLGAAALVFEGQG